MQCSAEMGLQSVTLDFKALLFLNFIEYMENILRPSYEVMLCLQ